jgi:TRAP-type C4-dicarboxylate transport system substrate-binding protein
VPEVPQAFATGTISAMITSSATGTQTKSWEFVKNYYTTNAMHPKNVVVVNSRAFKALSGAQKKALTERGRGARSAAGTVEAARARRQQDARRQRHDGAHADAAMMSALARSATPSPPSG